MCRSTRRRTRRARPRRAGWLVEDLNDAIDDARDKDILIYVHGAKVNFYNACAFAAQLDHFMGRDMTSVAFSWPTRQDIIAYSFGDDVNRAYKAAPALATLIETIAEKTDARRIHILCWSAGARVLSSALAELRERHPDLTHEQLQEKLRVGTAYFAAGDVPTSEFVEKLPAINDVAREIIVTVSSNDIALKNASIWMGGGNRLGQEGGELS